MLWDCRLEKYFKFKNWGIGISKNPNKFKEKKVIIKEIKIRKKGSWNCIPHATLYPRYRNKINVNASIIKEEEMPIEVIMKLFLMEFLCPISSIKFNILIDNTGKTHGIAFSTKPPINAISNINNEL